MRRRKSGNHPVRNTLPLGIIDITDNAIRSGSSSFDRRNAETEKFTSHELGVGWCDFHPAVLVGLLELRKRRDRERRGRSRTVSCLRLRHRESSASRSFVRRRPAASSGSLLRIEAGDRLHAASDADILTIFVIYLLDKGVLRGASPGTKCGWKPLY